MKITMIRRTQMILYSIFVTAYLGFLLYFLTLRPGGPSGNPAVIWAVTCFASGSMIMVAIFAFNMYLFRHKEKAALYFALMCVSAGIRFLVMEGSQTITGLIPDFPKDALYAVRYAAISFVIIGITNFIFEIFAPPDYRKRRLFMNVMTGIVFAYVAVISTIRGGDNIYIKMPMILLTIGIQAYCIFIIVKSPEFKTNPLYQIYFAAILLYVAEVVLAGLFGSVFPNVAVVSQSLFVIAHTILLSDRYSRTINENELLEKLNRTKTEFLQDMSHEMKVPLTVIATGIDYADREIKKGGGDPSRAGNLTKASGALEKIQNETQRLGRMVGGMVDLASMNEISKNRRRVDFADLLQNSAESFRLALEQRNNKLMIEIAPGLPDVFVEKDRFTQVITNLLSNAAEHTKDGKITLAADFDSKFITVRVSDTGCGIKAELLPNVFKRGVSGRGGTGYGLYICKIVVEAHGGAIKIESAQDKGTTATFTVPVYGGQEAGHKL